MSLEIGIGIDLRLETQLFVPPLDPLFADFLAVFDEFTIVGTNPVTAWNNRGLGGSAFDLNVVVGTGANLTRSVLNGNTGIISSGGAGLETTVGQVLGINTAFAVFKPTLASPGTTQIIADGRQDSGARNLIYSVGGMSNRYAVFQGTADVGLAEAYTNDLVVITVESNQDATTKLTVSNTGNATGNAGSNNWDFATVFANINNVQAIQGLFLFFAVIEEALSAQEITDIQNFLAAKYL